MECSVPEADLVVCILSKMIKIDSKCMRSAARRKMFIFFLKKHETPNSAFALLAVFALIRSLFALPSVYSHSYSFSPTAHQLSASYPDFIILNPT